MTKTTTTYTAQQLGDASHVSKGTFQGTYSVGDIIDTLFGRALILTVTHRTRTVAKRTRYATMSAPTWDLDHTPGQPTTKLKAEAEAARLTAEGFDAYVAALTVG